MGCVCCIPASLEETEYLLQLPEGILHITSASADAKIEEEWTNLIAASFCGSTTVSPEGALSWAFDPNSSGANPTDPLTTEPSDARKKYFKYLASSCFHQCVRHGGCFALVNASGKMVAATMTIPPNDRQLHSLGCCEEIFVMNSTGGYSAVPPEMKEGPGHARISAVTKQLEKCHHDHAPGRHLYIYMIAVAMDEQGHGYGRRLMEFLNSAADHMNVDSYLECSGGRNERFYSRNGFEIKERYTLKVGDSVFNPDGLGGFVAMVRPPNQSLSSSSAAHKNQPGLVGAPLPPQEGKEQELSSVPGQVLAVDGS